MSIEGIGLVILGYLAGSIPTGLLLTKAFSEVDPAKRGAAILGRQTFFGRQGKHWESLPWQAIASRG